MLAAIPIKKRYIPPYIALPYIAQVRRKTHSPRSGRASDFAKHSGVGPGKIGLLEAIRDSGSLAQGARNIGMSYRHAWLLVESLKRTFREPVTEIYAGGK